jgi:phosphoglucomutase
MVPALLAAEMTARLGRDPGDLYGTLANELGECFYDRVDAPATLEQKKRLAHFSPEEVEQGVLAGERIVKVLTQAPGNGASLGRLKVLAESGWFAARPSGTEDLYKIYAESFRGPDHLKMILAEAQALVDGILKV